MSNPTDAPQTRITQRDFARYASFMASHAAKWAADCLDTDVSRPMTREALDRFTARMAGWLETINGR